MSTILNLEPPSSLFLNRDVKFFRALWNCLRNFRKWRMAQAIGKAAVILWNNNEEDSAVALIKIHRRLYTEIHGAARNRAGEEGRS